MSAGVTERPRVLIAEDHVPTRATVREALEAGGFDVVAEVASATEATRLALQTTPDVCLLDIRMPGNGIKAAGEIVSALPSTAVVMLTASRDDEDLFDALKAGAVGYLPKGTDPGRLPAALRGVLAGEAAMPSDLVARVLAEFRRGRRRRVVALPGRRPADLTPREYEILEMLSDGLTTEQVADRLFVAPVTVRWYVSQAVKKLRVPDRDSAVRLLRQQRDASR